MKTQAMGDIYITFGQDHDNYFRSSGSAHHPRLPLPLILSRDQLKELGIQVDDDHRRVVLPDGTVVLGTRKGIKGRLFFITV